MTLYRLRSLALQALLVQQAQGFDVQAEIEDCRKALSALLSNGVRKRD